MFVLRRFFFRGVDLEEDEVDDSIEDGPRTDRFGAAVASAASSSELYSSVEAIAVGRNQEMTGNRSDKVLAEGNWLAIQNASPRGIRL